VHVTVHHRLLACFLYKRVYWQHLLSARKICCGSVVRHELLGHSLVALYAKVVIADKITDEPSVVAVLVLI
jgi:hypothetical protein